jgi:hypothetical protein
MDVVKFCLNSGRDAFAMMVYSLYRNSVCFMLFKRKC